MSDQFDPYYKWLAIPPDEQPPNHYRLLGLRVFELDEDVIDNAAEQRMTLLRSRQSGKHAALSQRLLNEISSARVCLLDPAKRRQYDEQLRREVQELPLASPDAGAAVGAVTERPTPVIALPPHSAPPPPSGTPLPDLASGDPMQTVPLPYVAPQYPMYPAPYSASDASQYAGEYAPAPYGGAPYGPPQYGAPQFGDPAYGGAQYGATAYGSPQYSPPHGAAPAYDSAQYASTPSGYAAPQYGVQPSPARRPAPVNPMVWVYLGVGAVVVLLLLAAVPVVLWTTMSGGGSTIADKSGDDRNLRPEPKPRTSPQGPRSDAKRVVRPAGPERKAPSTPAGSSEAGVAATPENGGQTGGPSEPIIGPQPIVPVQESRDGVVNLLALIDLDQDARPRKKWAMNGGRLECTQGNFVPKVVVPYEPPEEYDVTVVFSQPRLRNGISIVMPKNGSSFFWAVGGDNGHMGFSVNGLAVNQTSRREPGSVQAGQVHTTVVQVRNDGVKALLDGRVVAEYQTDYRDMKVDNWRRIKEEKQIAICADDPATFYTFQVTEIRGRGKFTRPVPENAAGAAAGGLPADNPPADAAPIDLLAEIDPRRDSVRGQFRVEDGALLVPLTQAAQLEIASPPPSAYRLEVVAEKAVGNDSLNLGLVCGERQVMMVFDSFNHSASGLNLLDKASADRNASTYRGRIFADSEPKSIVCTVQPGKIHVTCDGKTIVDWQGDPSRLSLDQRFWRARTPNRLIVGAWQTSFKITRLQLTALPDA